MIQQSRHAIYIHLPSGESAPLLPATVAELLCQQPMWGEHVESWQVEEMAMALIHHLHADLQRNSIECEELVSALQQLALVCGLATTASAEEDVVSTNLYQLAQNAGGAFELAFYQSVERSIADLRARGACLVSFVGLRACAKMLVGAKNWCKSCQQTSDEIVAFIRSQMGRWSNERPVLFAVS